MVSNTVACNFVAPTTDEGITVPGSVSNQQFTTVNSFDVDTQSEVIILKLRGKVEENTVNRPILVSTKVTCQTCGKKSAAKIRFCPNCGTALHIV
jgi:DNA-directed RNA polymerase subunit M/transcription elongation factor TFIIS